jgi:uncharacterized membrane protein YbhN (UPF0104 family)
MSRRSPARQPVLAGHDAVVVPTRDLIVAALLAALAGVATRAVVDGAGGLWAWASPVASRINWGLVPLIAGLTTLHFLVSAISVRAVTDGVAGRRLCVWEITSAQFAGSAANRLAPGGLGSAAIYCRYLTRRGLLGCEATAAVATVGITRCVTKLALLALAAWYAPGDWRLPAVPGAARHSYVAFAAVITGAIAALALVVAWRRGRRIWTAIVGVAASLRRIVRQPGSLALSLAASTAAHCALALAFVVSVLAVHGAGPHSLGTLPVVYLLGATAGAAVPTPAGVGSTEAALIAALAAVHVPAAAAAQGVLLFRVMTFWAPVPVGILSSRWLRGRGGL